MFGRRDYERKHPHHIHIGLVIVLLALEFTLFKGHGILYVLGTLGLGFAESYAAALGGDFGAMDGLLPAVIAFIVALVVYYILAGILIIIFRLFWKDDRYRSWR